MDLIDQLRILASRVANMKDVVQTEEATKTAMIMPLIQALGYNPFDPFEVTPELVADIGTKKGEKVDYAILRDGKPIIIFECKKVGSDLKINHASQLFRYFHVTDARFAVLTNGIKYQFFTDLDQQNKMDERPFFEFDILDFKEGDVDELKKFAKSAYDLESILGTASDLKYTRVIQQKLSDWATNPSEDFVRLVSYGLLNGRNFTSQAREQFTEITKRAFDQLISSKINERLKGAMGGDVGYVPPAPPPAPVESLSAEPTTHSKIVTTPEEIEAFHFVQAMLRGVVSPDRVVMRDGVSYCTILLDDTNRKPICRLRFNNPQRLRVGVFGGGRDEEIIDIDRVGSIFSLSDRLIATASAYDIRHVGDNAQPLGETA